MYYLCTGKTVRVLNAKYAVVVAIVASLCAAGFAKLRPSQPPASTPRSAAEQGTQVALADCCCRRSKIQPI
jgi:hypothetical protein